MLRDTSLQVKLPLILTGVLGVVILALSAAAYGEVRRAAANAAEERLLRATDQLADLIVASLPNRLGEATDLAAAPELRRFVAGESDPADHARALATLDSVGEPDNVLAVELRDLDGRRLLGTGDTAVTTGAAVPAPDSAGIGSIILLGDGLAYPIVAPVTQDETALAAVVIWRSSRVEPEALESLMELIGIPGRMLLGGDDVWTDLLEAVDGPPIATEAMADRQNALVSYARSDGEPHYAVIRSLAPAPWYLVIEQERRIALEAARAFLFRLLILVPSGLMVAAVAAWIVGGTITRGLRATTVAAEAIAAGETGQRVTVLGADELGRLGASFNAMAEQVEESQRALHEMNASLRIMLDGAPLPIIAMDLQGRVRTWNRAATATFGWEPDEVLGGANPLTDARGEPFDVPQNGEDAVGREFRTFRRDGGAIDLFVARAPTYAPSGEVDGHMLVCEDISARKRAEQQLEAYAAELARSNEELENFAYAASHDLREPLRMVRSFTRLLAERYEGRLDADADRFIGFAVDGATRMESLIKALLEYSRVDGRPTLSDTPLDGVVEQAITNLASGIAEAGAIVTKDPMPSVTGDPEQLLRVFQNLISNAIKFRADRTPRVHVSAREDGDRVVISVRDDGIGISPEYFDRIFVVFKRLHGPAEYPGTGMGLAICRKIVERHGGDIWVESSPGEGATFYFSLPRAAAQVA